MAKVVTTRLVGKLLRSW